MIKYLFVSTVICLVLAWAGCSNSPGDSTNSSGAPLVAAYFPLAPGYTMIYSVTTPDTTKEITFSVGEHKNIGMADAVNWIVVSGTGSVDTSYLVATDSALYYLETPYSSPEKILSLPLTPGATWPRYYNYNVIGTYNDGIGTAYDSSNGGFTQPLGDTTSSGSADSSNTNNNGGTAAKNYPSEGANTFTVIGVEPIDLGTLGTFSDAVKISNIGYFGTTNLYWFVPNVGLVKYLLGTNADGTATPQVAGLLVSHS
jgi:hypothetical protein